VVTLTKEVQMLSDSIISKFKVDPRDYQRRIVRQALDMFTGKYISRSGASNPPFKSVMVESPTGSGKTVIGFLTASALSEELGIDPDDLAVAWIAMRRNLLTQAERENISKGFNIKNIHFTSMFNKLPDELVALKKAGKKILFVVDECHHDTASSMVHLHNLLVPDFVLGLSATPYRTDKANLCFEKVIKDCGIHQLIAAGYLSPYDHFTITDWKPETVVERFTAEPERWGKSVMFFKNLEECFVTKALLDAQGYKSEVVTGASDAEQQIDDFQEGKVNILINCMKLTEGFDCPDIKTVWVRDSGKGTTTQMAGRVFRIHPDLPVKQVVQSKVTRWPCLKTAMPKIQYSYENGEWMSLTINPKIDEMTHNSRRAIASAVVDIPVYILNKQAKGRRKPSATERVI